MVRCGRRAAVGDDSPVQLGAELLEAKRGGEEGMSDMGCPAPSLYYVGYSHVHNTYLNGICVPGTAEIAWE